MSATPAPPAPAQAADPTAAASVRTGDPGRPVRWGLIGAGWIARSYVAPAIVACPDAELVGVFDPDPAAAAAIDAPARDTLDALLADDTIEAVYVATPNHLHPAGVAAAAAAGKAVLCEKPMARTVHEAEAMAAAVDAAGVFYATAFDQRWHGAHRALTRLIAAGDLGTVTAVMIHYACWTPADWAPGDWPHDNWRVDPARAGGGALIDLAPHGVDLIAALLGGDELVELSGYTQRRVHDDVPVDDGAVLIGRTGNGVLLTHRVAYNCPDELPRRRLEVVGTRGLARAVNTMGQTPGGTLRIFPAAGGPPRNVDFAAEDHSPFLTQISAFGDALRGRATWPFPAERDLRGMRLLHAVNDGATAYASPNADARPGVPTT